ncbi:hypothetical protein BDV33DRAFT_174203 [Aspergillus novoparasiticus]|uniref:Uncharacterized protein n=1 Tax=Aspergillus novoparasiticus TaxID=986946 RepID=A0A5N6ENL0_9EURO|nr:hypothetical protein BDV33DRAFT_174203 [Aspergillus novoparasiticus]
MRMCHRQVRSTQTIVDLACSVAYLSPCQLLKTACGGFINIILLIRWWQISFLLIS